MKTSSLMMCALVALTACGTGVKQSVRTPVEMGERIELKTPDPKMGLTINEALAARSSSRDFSPEMLSLEELSGVLWAAAGVNREDGHLTAPSAMALYPIRVYAFLPEGVYRYDSKPTRVSVDDGAIAQLVEQRTENPCVPGSIPGGTTQKTSHLQPCR